MLLTDEFNFKILVVRGSMGGKEDALCYCVIHGKQFKRVAILKNMEF